MVGVFNNFVEIGRIAYVSIGPFKHRLVAIVDVINQKSALVDGPGVPRKAMAFKHMRLLKYKVAIAQARGPEPYVRLGRRARSTSSGRRMPSTKASSPGEREPLSTTSRGSSCPRPRRPGITRSTRPTPLSRRPPKRRLESNLNSVSV